MDIKVHIPIIYILLSLISINSEAICYKKSGSNLGEANIPHCGDPGSTGMKWCKATRQCLKPGSDDICPECDYDDAKRYCSDTDECCDSCVYNSCTDPDSYTYGLTNIPKCGDPSTGYTYCESTEECLPPGSGEACPICTSGKFCTFPGGGKCCDDCPDIGGSYGASSVGEYLNQMGSSSEDRYCLRKSGENGGVPNIPECGDSSTGYTWCATTQKCIPPGSDEMCPECDYDREQQYCLSSDECCTYDCTQMEQTCSTPTYTEGVDNRIKCRGSGEKYCESTGECVTGVECPVCPSSGDNTEVCQLAGGKQCCNFCQSFGGSAKTGKTEKKDSYSATSRSGVCYKPSGRNSGVRNIPKCGNNIGYRYCETTDKCIEPGSDEMCPECEAKLFNVEANQYCQDRDECCDYDCSLQQQTCQDASDYTEGVENLLRCHGAGETYCESTGDCIEPGSNELCPVCSSSTNTEWCQLIGEWGQCCNVCTNTYGAVSAGTDVNLDNDIFSIKPLCYKKSGMNAGITNIKECGNNIGYKWCAATEKCIEPGSNELCPECEYDLAGKYCIDTDECCSSCNDNTCQDAINYTKGEKNRVKCKIKGELYCESKDECLSDGAGVTCPVCKSGTKWCQLTGGGQCCADCDELMSFGAVKAVQTEYNMIETAEESIGEGYCLRKSGENLGVTNIAECGNNIGYKWCETTQKCIAPGSDEMCPECEYDRENQYCLSSDECCTYDCTQIAQTCENPTYIEGVDNRIKCRGSGEHYCESTDECVTGVQCAVCPSSGNSQVCQLAGGKQCCNFCASFGGSAKTGKREKKDSYSSTSTSGACYKKSGSNSGVTNIAKCGNNIGYKYCETTDKCIEPGSDEMCPECGNVEGTQYCIDRDECCDYDCTVSSCSEASDYDEGERNIIKCKNADDLYCESKDECLAPGSGVVCPICESGTKWCQLKGGGQCCDDCSKLPGSYGDVAPMTKTVYMPRYTGSNGYDNNNNITFGEYHDVILILVFAAISFVSLGIGIFVGKQLKRNPVQKINVDEINDI